MTLLRSVHSGNPKAFCALMVGLIVGMGACSPQEAHRTIEPQQIAPRVATSAPKTVAIGEFINRSSYMNGIFADSTDRLGKQAEQILITHLSQSSAFKVVDRRNLDFLARESRFLNEKQHIAGAPGVVTGAVTEFGRRETGTKGLGGLISKSKTQTVYAKVSISLVDSRTSAVIGTYQGAGEYELTNSEVLGFGGRAGYDSTLADKVLNLAIMEAVSRMAEAQ